LPKDAALKSVTLYPARIWGVSDRLGSLEIGKSASVIVTNGDPLEIRTSVLRVFIAGEEMPMDSRHTLLYEKFRKRP
jgi:imidazolonepropionase-like amidohydrolase